MTRQYILRAIFTLSVLTLNSAASLSAQERFSVWEKTIAKFEEEDAKNSPSPGGVVFVGSSSIRLWDLKEMFPGKGYLNRGFGGSELADSVHFLDRLVLKHRPSTIVLYAGDNDLAKGKSPETIRDDLAAFIRKVRQTLPEAKIIYLSIKPSIERWKLYGQQSKANMLCKDVLAQDSKTIFVDVGSCLLNDEGTPDPQYFVDDGLHLSPKGYQRWVELLQKHL